MKLLGRFRIYLRCVDNKIAVLCVIIHGINGVIT